jgi:multisubunit Na+/H+ antiporter MnhB subunit
VNVVLLIDLLLGLILVGLAAWVVLGRHLFRSIVFFVAFGLAMALVWARLGAVDLALADAAIGAGLTGALMLAAFRRMVELDSAQAVTTGSAHTVLAVLIAVLASGMVATIGLTAMTMEQAPGAAGLAVFEALPATGLGNPITGVLLAWRGFDTLVEMVVLLTAFLGARVVAREDWSPRSTVAGFDLPLLRTLVALIVPLASLIALHLLWIGSDQPGGAFQAGSVLAAAGVLLLLTAQLLPAPASTVWLRLALVLGVAGIGILVLLPMARGLPPMGWLGRGSLLFAELLMMVSIACTLSLLFAGSPGLRGGPR